jgi:hypothetical protein
MFALVSACAVMALWLRLRLAIDPEWVQGRGVSMSEGLPIACLAVWFAQCIFSPRHSSISPWLTPRCELPAVAILLSGVDTVQSIEAGYMCISCHFSPERLKKYLENVTNTNAVLGYGFILTCTLALVIAMPRARESLRQNWFVVLCVVVSLNIGLVVWFCNWRASLLDLSHR